MKWKMNNYLGLILVIILIFIWSQRESINSLFRSGPAPESLEYNQPGNLPQSGPRVVSRDEKINMDVFEKCRAFTRSLEVKEMGIYPYFRPIESAADTVVTIQGREQIMIGSNNYLGLTTHPKVKEAAVAAVWVRSFPASPAA